MTMIIVIMMMIKLLLLKSIKETQEKQLLLRCCRVVIIILTMIMIILPALRLILCRGQVLSCYTYAEVKKVMVRSYMMLMMMMMMMQMKKMMMMVKENRSMMQQTLGKTSIPSPNPRKMPPSSKNMPHTRLPPKNIAVTASSNQNVHLHCMQ